MSACTYCGTWVGRDHEYCSEACATAATYDTLDEREIAYARDDRELDEVAAADAA